MKPLTANIDYDITKYDILILGVNAYHNIRYTFYTHRLGIIYTNILFAIAKKNGNVLATQNFLAPARRPRGVDDGV